jgi:hypothetical protein
MPEVDTYKIHKMLIKSGAKVCHGSSGPCFAKGTRQRQSTFYADEESNWVVACPACMEEIE